MYLRVFRILYLSVLCLSAVGSAAAGASPGKKMQITGYLVDVACATDERAAAPGWGEKHTRACLLMPACVRSGYAVLADDNEVVRFDTAGNRQAHQMILANHQETKWRVRVRGRRSGDQLAVSKIELLNQ